MPEGDGHWSQDFQGEGVDATNREAFVSANSKYSTMEAAVVGGYNAQKLSGKPFKCPESLDKLPDDASRAEFTAQANKALGINIPKDIEALKDINFGAGLAEGKAVNESFVGLIKTWAVENGIQTSTVEKMIGLYNGPLTEYAQKAQLEKMEADKAAAAEACNTALVEHFKGEQKVKELSVLMHRAIVDHMGLSAEESGEFVDAMANTILTTNPTMAKGMLTLLSSVSMEGNTEVGDGPGGGGIKQNSPYEAKKARWPKSQSLWGEPSDKWDDQGIETKRSLGYKDPNAQ